MAEERKSLTFEDYDKVSVHYDDARRPVGLQSFKKHLRNSVHKDNHKILDLGCGTGNYLQHLAGEGVEIVGIEQSEGMVAKCNAKIEKLGINNAKTVQGSAFELPFADEEFSAVITTQTVHHFGGKEQIGKVFKEVSRVLKKDGLFIINHCEFKQAFTCWWTQFLPSFKPFAEKNYLDSAILIDIAKEDFDHQATDMIKETLTRQDLFENPRYIVSPEGRLTDSSWKIAPEEEVNEAVSKVKSMIENKTWEDWFDKIMNDINEFGQSNNVVLKKK